MDPTRTNALMAALSYVHPALVGLGLAMALWALSDGLTMRKARIRKRKHPKGVRRRHTRVAKPAAIIVAVGFAIGPTSSLLLRDWTPFASFHGWCGLAATFGFSWVGLQGLKIEKRRDEPTVVRHGLVGLFAALAGLLTAITGIEMLP